MSVVQNNVSLPFDMAIETAAHAARTPASSAVGEQDAVVEGSGSLVRRCVALSLLIL